METRLKDFCQRVSINQAFECLTRDYNLPPDLHERILHCLNPQIRHPVNLPLKYIKGFDTLWEKRCPIVLSVKDRIQLSWDPLSLKCSYGKQPCFIIDCQNPSNQTKSQLQVFLDKMGTTGEGLFKVKVQDGPYVK